MAAESIPQVRWGSTPPSEKEAPGLYRKYVWIDPTDVEESVRIWLRSEGFADPTDHVVATFVDYANERMRETEGVGHRVSLLTLSSGRH